MIHGTFLASVWRKTRTLKGNIEGYVTGLYDSGFCLSVLLPFIRKSNFSVLAHCFFPFFYVKQDT